MPRRAFFVFRAMPRYEFAERTEPDEFWQMLSEADRLWFETPEDREARYGRAELADRIRKAIKDCLDKPHREIILAYLELGSFRALARKFGVSHHTVRKRFMQAIQQLRTELDVDD